MTRHEPRGGAYGVPSGAHLGYPADRHARATGRTWHGAGGLRRVSVRAQLPSRARARRGCTSRRLNAARGACFACAFWVATLAFFVTTRASAPATRCRTTRRAPDRETARRRRRGLPARVLPRRVAPHRRARGAVRVPRLDARGDAARGRPARARDGRAGWRCHGRHVRRVWELGGPEGAPRGDHSAQDGPGRGLLRRLRRRWASTGPPARGSAGSPTRAGTTPRTTRWCGRSSCRRTSPRAGRGATARRARVFRRRRQQRRRLRSSEVCAPKPPARSRTAEKGEWREAEPAVRPRCRERSRSTRACARTSATPSAGWRAAREAWRRRKSAAWCLCCGGCCSRASTRERAGARAAPREAYAATWPGAGACAPSLCLADDDTLHDLLVPPPQGLVPGAVHLEARYGRAALQELRALFIAADRVLQRRAPTSATKSERGRFDALIDWNVRRWLDDGECGLSTDDGGGDDDDGRGFGDRERLSVLASVKRACVFFGDSLLRVAAPEFGLRLRIRRRASAAARLASRSAPSATRAGTSRPPSVSRLSCATPTPRWRW